MYLIILDIGANINILYSAKKKVTIELLIMTGKANKQNNAHNKWSSVDVVFFKCPDLLDC